MSIHLKIFVSVVAIVLVAAVAVGMYQARVSYHHDSVDWRILADDRFSLDPGEIRVGYEIPRAPRFGVWPNFEVDSKYPVTLGFVPASFRDLTTRDLQDRMVPIRCEVSHIRQTLLSCSELKVRQESYVFFILDERGPGAASNNYVHVRYSARMCFTCKTP